MDQLDLTIRNGIVATASETMRCDVGISGEKIVAIAGSPTPLAFLTHPGVFPMWAR